MYEPDQGRDESACYVRCDFQHALDAMVAVKTGMKTRSQLDNEAALAGGVLGQTIDAQPDRIQEETRDLLCKLTEEGVPYDWANDYGMMPVFCSVEIPLEVHSSSYIKEES